MGKLKYAVIFMVLLLGIGLINATPTYLCNGTATLCEGIFTSGACGTQAECSWHPSYCDGNETPCTSFPNQTVCENQAGCLWGEGCNGTAIACDALITSEDCGNQEECSWHENDTCSGDTDTCGSILTEIPCEIQVECSWLSPEGCEYHNPDCSLPQICQDNVCVNTLYPENNTPRNIVNAGYDLIVAIPSSLTPYIPVIIGIGILMFVITSITAGIGLIIFGIFKLFTKKK